MRASNRVDISIVDGLFSKRRIGAAPTRCVEGPPRHPMKTWEITVFRIREQGDDDTKPGWDRHWARAEAVHAALQDAPDWKVQSLGTELKDREHTHETAKIVLEWVGQVAQDPLVHSAVQQGVTIAGDAVKDLVKDGLVEIVKFVGSAMVGSLITRFMPSVKNKKVDSVYAQTVAPGGEVAGVSIRHDPTKKEGVAVSINADLSL
jgi:hypothetical protein